MKKADAISLLGGTYRSAAELIGITQQAVRDWPEDLPDRIRDRVQAVMWRQSQSASAEKTEGLSS